VPGNYGAVGNDGGEFMVLRQTAAEGIGRQINLSDAIGAIAPGNICAAAAAVVQIYYRKR